MKKDPLKQYVEQQAAVNTDPRLVRYNLIRSGWPAQKVDKEIWRHYSKGRKLNIQGNKSLLKALVVVVILLVGVMAFIFSGISDVFTKKPPEITPTNPTPGSGTPVAMKTCDVIDNSVEKDACYRQKLTEGFDCDGLEDKIERNFCFRALDASLFSS